MNIAAMYQAVQKYREEQQEAQDLMDSTLQSSIAALLQPPSSASDTTRPDDRFADAKHQFKKQWRLDANRTHGINKYLVQAAIHTLQLLDNFFIEQLK